MGNWVYMFDETAMQRADERIDELIKLISPLSYIGEPQHPEDYVPVYRSIIKYFQDNPIVYLDFILKKPIARSKIVTIIHSLNPNENRRVYCIENELCKFNFDKYLEFINDGLLRYKLYPIKNNPEDLHFYNPKYPWDFKSNNVRVGDNIHDIHEKSRGCHFQRSQVVQK